MSWLTEVLERQRTGCADIWWFFFCRQRVHGNRSWLFNAFFFFPSFPYVTPSFPYKIESIMIKTFLFPLTGGQCCASLPAKQEKSLCCALLVTVEKKSAFQSIFFHFFLNVHSLPQEMLLLHIRWGANLTIKAKSAEVAARSKGKWLGKLSKLWMLLWLNRKWGVEKSQYPDKIKSNKSCLLCVSWLINHLLICAK